MATLTKPAHTIDGVALPAPGTWAIDPGHAQIGFVGRHFGLTKIRGRFTDIKGMVIIAEDLAESSVSLDIEVASLSSGDAARDDHLRSADHFDVARYPTATFRSTSIAVEGATATMSGDLSVKGVTREVELDVEYLGNARDPWDNERAVFSAVGTINREDWGLTWNMILEAGGWLVSRKVRLEIEVELIRQVA